MPLHQAQNLHLCRWLGTNGVLGMVRQWQTMFYEERYSETDLDRPPDFIKLAQAYGLEGFRSQDEGNISAALESALACIASGKAIDEQLM